MTERTEYAGSPVRVGDKTLPWPLMNVDFDGVLADYRGFATSHTALPPMPDARRLLRYLRARGYSIVIHSARPTVEIEAWLRKYRMASLVDAISPTKMPGLILDDRCARYDPRKTVEENIVEAERPAWWEEEDDGREAAE